MVFEDQNNELHDFLDDEEYDDYDLNDSFIDDEEYSEGKVVLIYGKIESKILDDYDFDPDEDELLLRSPVNNRTRTTSSHSTSRTTNSVVDLTEARRQTLLDLVSNRRNRNNSQNNQQQRTIHYYSDEDYEYNPRDFEDAEDFQEIEKISKKNLSPKINGNKVIKPNNITVNLIKEC